MQTVGKVGKRSTIYPPKEVTRRLGLDEGQGIVFRIEGDRLVIEKVKDPWMLAVKSRKWAKTTIEEFERESKELQKEIASEEG